MLFSENLSKEALKYPSPGNYNVGSDMVSLERGRGFAKSLRSRGISLLGPSPAQYKVDSKLNTTHGTMGWRNTKLKSFITPAPGAYDILS